MMTKKQAREFASIWLPAWTGNNPEKLAGFHSDDALYLDPAIPNGVRGKDKLLSYS
jgi:ketosteroid isomerase-like protein